MQSGKAEADRPFVNGVGEVETSTGPEKVLIDHQSEDMFD